MRRGPSGEAEIRGFDPFDCFLTNGINSKDKAERERIALELLPNCKPKLKAVEMKGDMNVTITVTIAGIE